jgi:hypothetical protein
LATKIRVLASPKFTNVVLSSSSLAVGTVIAIIPRDLATGYGGAVTVEASTEAVVNFEANAPLPIVDNSGVVAKPVYSAFQQDMTVLKNSRQMRLGGASGRDRASHRSSMVTDEDRDRRALDEARELLEVPFRIRPTDGRG